MVSSTPSATVAVCGTASAALVCSIREISEDDHDRQEREPSHCHHPGVSDRSSSSRFDAGDRSDSCNDYCDSEPRDPVHGHVATRYEPVEWGRCCRLRAPMPPRSSPPRSRIRRRQWRKLKGIVTVHGATLVRSTWHRQEINQVQKANRHQIGVCLPTPRLRAVPHPHRKRGGRLATLCGLRKER